MSTSRYRERHSTSGAKSDPGDAKVLADLARTDAHNHRPVAGDSELAEAVKVLARAHQTMIWSRQRQTNQLRSTLREFYPAALEAFDNLAGHDALAVLAIALTPTIGKLLSRSKIAGALRAPATTYRRTRRRDPDRAANRATRSTRLVADAMRHSKSLRRETCLEQRTRGWPRAAVRHDPQAAQRAIPGALLASR